MGEDRRHADTRINHPSLERPEAGWRHRWCLAGERPVELAQADAAPFHVVLRLASESALRVLLEEAYGFDEIPQTLGLIGSR
jgi:hypothetical protein